MLVVKCMVCRELEKKSIGPKSRTLVKKKGGNSCQGYGFVMKTEAFTVHTSYI